MVVRIRMELYSVKAGLENVKNHGLLKHYKNKNSVYFHIWAHLLYSEMYILCALTSYIYTRIKCAIYQRKTQLKPSAVSMKWRAVIGITDMCTPGFPHMFSLCTYMSL